MPFPSSHFILKLTVAPRREADKDSVMKLLVSLAAPVLSPPRHEAQNLAPRPSPPQPRVLMKVEHYCVFILLPSECPQLVFSPFNGLGGFSFTPFLCFHLLSFHFLALSLPSSSFFPPSVLIFLFPSHPSPHIFLPPRLSSSFACALMG